MSIYLTHIALHVNDLDACLEFYIEFAKLHVVKDRRPNGPTGKRIVWLAHQSKELQFIIILLPGGPGRNQRADDFSHLGFAMESKESVDYIALKAANQGILAWPCKQEPYPVGYYCGVRDPDGNFVEFSYGQPLGPGAEEIVSDQTSHPDTLPSNPLYNKIFKDS